MTPEKRPKRLLLGLHDGELLLSEDETTKLYKMADDEGVSPEIFMKSMLSTTDLLYRHGLLKLQLGDDDGDGS